MHKLMLFFALGGILSILEICIFWFLMFFMHYLIANFFAFIFSSFLGVLVYRKFVFQKTQRLASEIAKTYLLNTFGLILNTLMLWILVRAGLLPIIAKLIATILIAFYGYFGRIAFIYKES